jgi:hypothetical protein
MDELWFCGEVVAPDGLGHLETALGRCSWPVRLWRSGYDGSLVLRSDPGPVSLHMDAGQGSTRVFSGTIDDVDRDAALQLLAELSTAMAESRLRHRIELYSTPDGPLIGYLHHGWPKTTG